MKAIFPLLFLAFTQVFFSPSLESAAASILVGSNEVERIQKQQYDELEKYFDSRLERSRQERTKYWQRNFSSLKAYEKSIESKRQDLWRLLGGDTYRLVPLKPRVEMLGETERFEAFRLWLPVTEGFQAVGVLLRPKGPGPFPAVICIHGMTGTPESLSGLTEAEDYHRNLGRRAVDAGFLVFAPLDMNNFKKRSWLDRKAQLVGERLQALEQVKIRRVVDYLERRPDVAKNRIGAYGISWGGRTVMYLAALDRRIAAAAISGHFNDFVPKMVTPSPHYTAFIQTPEDYAFFPNQANRFSDADVVSMICPRPVLIEQGREDKVVHWPMSVSAFAEVTEIYRKLKIEDRAEHHIFEGGHVMHGDAPLRFLQKHLTDQRP